VKFNGTCKSGKPFGSENPARFPSPTTLNVCKSYTFASRELNLTGRYPFVVSTFSEANAGKEKFAGARLKYVGTELFQSPDARMRGVSLLKAKLGTRGIQIPRTTAILSKSF
jgi:hypothetical protein